MKGINRNEAYLDTLLNGKGVRSKLSARQYLIEHQDEIPLVILVSYIDSIHERAVINDGKIVKFQH